MQAIAQDVVEKNGLKEFEELMREVAELPAEQRGTVAVFSQGVLALAQLQKKVTGVRGLRNGNERQRN